MARTTVASDDFNRANEDPLSGGGNWTQLHNFVFDGNIELVSNHIASQSTGGGGMFARWTGAGSFTADQYAKATIGALAFNGTAYQGGVICRASADVSPNHDFYGIYVSDDSSSSRTTVLFKIVNGTTTILHSDVVTWANGDTVELECEDTTIRGMKNGVALGGSFTTTDASIASGIPGVWISGDSGVPTLDDWDSGNLTTAVADGAYTSPIFRVKLRQF